MRKLILVLLAGLLPGIAFSQSVGDALTKKDTVQALSLIKGGADVNAKDNMGNTPMMTACRWADDTTVSFLLRHGATADSPKSPKGRTPLMIACAYYSGKKICAMLISYGANVNATASDGTTALMLAAMNAKLDVVMLLLGKGAKPEMKDQSGKTALDYAKTAEVSDYLKNSVKDTRIDKAGVITLLEKYK